MSAPLEEPGRPGRPTDLRGGRVAQREADDEDCGDDSRHFRRTTRGGRANDAWQCGDANRYNNRNPHSSGHPPRVTSDDSHSRFRLAIHTTHRAAAARAVGLLRDSAVPHAARDAGGAQARRHHPLRRTEERVARTGAPKCDAGVLTLGMPVLGICYGMQLMTDMLGGRVAPGRASRVRSRDGARRRARRRVSSATLPRDLRVWASHGDYVEAAPPGFTVVATSANAPVAAMEGRRSPPVRLCCFTPKSPTPIAGSRSSGTSPSTCAAARATGRWRRSWTKRRRGSASRSATGRVVCGLSGGVDSTVAALLIHRAIGDRLTCIFVDNGVLRQDEAVAGAEALPRQAEAAARVRGRVATTFLTRLAGVTDPERSGRSSAARSSTSSRRRRPRSAHFDFLAQGTLYPDVIESVSVVGPSCGHQEPPQRRRAARAHALQAGRAAARAVQGRGAPAGARPRPGRGVRRPPAVSRARASPSASSARSRRPRLDLLRKADAIVVEEVRRPGSTRRSGRASPCCCRCRASA